MSTDGVRRTLLFTGRTITMLALTCVPIATACASDSGAPEASALPGIAIEEDLRIDGHAETLVPIQEVLVSPADRIALLQWQDHAVRFYDASGEFIGSVGSEGEGPGEFRRLVRGGWVGDTLWVSDTQLRRATLISPDLDVVRAVRNHERARPLPTDSGATYGDPSPYALYPGGGSLVWALRRIDPPPSEDDDAVHPVLHLSPEGYILNEVAVIPPGPEGVLVDLGGGGVAYGQIPFAPRQSWDISPNGSRLAILTTHMDAPEPYFRVYVADPQGRVVFDRSFPFEPEPIPAATMDSAIVATAARRDPSFRDEMEANLRAAPPDVYAEAERVVIGSDDRIWIGMRRRPEGTRWMVLSPVGEPIGEIVLPPRVELHVAGAERVWCTERDEFDVESVVRYRLQALDS